MAPRNQGTNCPPGSRRFRMLQRQENHARRPNWHRRGREQMTFKIAGRSGAQIDAERQHSTRFLPSCLAL